jgi:hypothetical protein
MDGRKNVMAGMIKGDIVFTPLNKIKRRQLKLNKETLGVLEELAS